MTIKIGILNETDENERRVAATPQISQLLNKLDVAWVMESGAGVQTGYPDSEYTAQKFTLLPSADAVFAESDIILHIAPATIKKADAATKNLGRKIITVGMADALWDKGGIVSAKENPNLIVFALDLLPRISRAQAMDVLSSMSTIAGYKAVILA